MNIGINGRHLTENKTGVGRYLSNLLREWSTSPRGHHFFVYFSTEHPTKEDEELLSRPAVSVRRIPRPVGTNSFLLWYIFSLSRALRKDNIDYFFSADYFLPPLPRQCMASMTIHDVSYLAHPEWFTPAYQVYCRIFSQARSKRANRIFTVSEFSRKEILTYIPMSADKISVIPLAADPAFTTQSSATTPLVTSPFFLYVGKMLNRRNIKQLIEAFDTYLSTTKHSEMKLVLRGSNETHPRIDIESMATRLNNTHMRDAVVLLNGYLNDADLSNLYKHATATFYLSSYEGFGLPVLESLVSGTPVVTAPGTPMAEIAGDAAVLVTPTNVQDISNIMTRLTTDAPWVNELQKRAHTRASIFDWAKTAKQTLDQIERDYEQR